MHARPSISRLIALVQCPRSALRRPPSLPDTAYGARRPLRYASSSSSSKCSVADSSSSSPSLWADPNRASATTAPSNPAYEPAGQSPLHLPLPRSITPRAALLLVRVPVPPEHWPSHLELASPLLLQLSKALKRVPLTSGDNPESVADGSAVSSASAAGGLGLGEFGAVAVHAVWDGVGTSEFFGPPPRLGGGAVAGRDEEGYPAELRFGDGTVVRYAHLTSEDVRSGKVLRDVQRGVAGMDLGRALKPDSADARLAAEAGGTVGEIDAEILVCTHGSRDCRCGDTGGALVRALHEEVERRGLGDRVEVGEVAHVGGHKYAANAILLPSLDLLSNLLPSDAPVLLDFVLSGRERADEVWKHWRGRYGLGEDAQRGVWNGVEAAHVEERLAEKGPVASASEAGARPTETDTPAEVKTVRVRFKTHDGEVREVNARMGETLLQLARRFDLPAMEGTCGGNLECATCHCYIPSDAPVPPESEAELDMLGYALGYRDGESRLGCQIRVDERLGRWAAGGGEVRLPRF